MKKSSNAAFLKKIQSITFGTGKGKVALDGKEYDAKVIKSHTLTCGCSSCKGKTVGTVKLVKLTPRRNESNDQSFSA